MNEEINYKKFEEQLGIIYPQLTDNEKEKIIQGLFKLWNEVLDNIEK